MTQERTHPMTMWEMEDRAQKCDARTRIQEVTNRIVRAQDVRDRLERLREYKRRKNPLCMAVDAVIDSFADT